MMMVITLYICSWMSPDYVFKRNIILACAMVVQIVAIFCWFIVFPPLDSPTFVRRVIKFSLLANALTACFLRPLWPSIPLAAILGWSLVFFFASQRFIR